MHTFRNHRSLDPLSVVVLILLIAAACGSSVSKSTAGEIRGELRQWHTLELDFSVGQEFAEEGDANPFAQYVFQADFEHVASGLRYRVPGFFAADGNAANTSSTSGDVWRVRFTPPEVGEWVCSVKLVRVSDSLTPLFAEQKTFAVTTSDKERPDFRAEGHLRYVGQRYLQFAGSGRFFLKAGVDSPETPVTVRKKSCCRSQRCSNSKTTSVSDLALDTAALVYNGQRPKRR